MGQKFNDDDSLEKEADVMGDRSIKPNVHPERSNMKCPRCREDTIQAVLRIGDQEIDMALADKLDDDYGDEELVSLRLTTYAGQRVNYFFRNLAELIQYHTDSRAVRNMGEYRDVWVILDENTRYLIGENHNESPKLALTEKVKPSNLLYEQQDLIGIDEDNQQTQGNESSGEPNGGIDHRQLQQAYILSSVITDLQQDSETDTYSLHVLSTYAGQLEIDSTTMNEIRDFQDQTTDKQTQIKSKLREQYNAALGTLRNDLAGRQDPLHPGSSLHESIAQQLDEAKPEAASASHEFDLRAQRDKVFEMRDHVMAGRIMANRPPLIALMGRSHIPGVDAKVGEHKFAYNTLADFLNGFKDGGNARQALETAIGRADDLPAPKKGATTEASAAGGPVQVEPTPAATAAAAPAAAAASTPFDPKPGESALTDWVVDWDKVNSQSTPHA